MERLRKIIFAWISCKPDTGIDQVPNLLDDFLRRIGAMAQETLLEFIENYNAMTPQQARRATQSHARRVNSKPPKAPKVPKQPKARKEKPTATHYDTLQVARTADDETISAAYRSLCKRAHPDNWPHNAPLRQAGEARMKKYTEAFAVLKNPEKRREYDRSLRG
jgi:hypothetical protein